MSGWIMTESTEQRVCIKFCSKIGKTASETFDLLKKAYGDDVMGRTQVFQWFRRFKDGRESVESDARSGRPSTSRNDVKVEQVRTVVRSDRRMTVREIADEVGIAKTVCHVILTEDLGMRRVSAKFVPRLLTEDQRELRMLMASELFERSCEDPEFLSNIITGDETWVYGYDPETKKQSSEWKTPSSPRPKKARQVRSKIKVMLILFFDRDGVVHYEFAPDGQTINKEFYRDVLRRLRDSVRRKRPAKWNSGKWMLHHDNAPAHSSHVVQNFLTKHGTVQVPQPPYSPDLAPCDFFAFPKLKKTLKGRRFEDVTTIKQKAIEQLLTIPKNDFQSCFQEWQQRWAKCVASQGRYFEGD